MGDKSHTHPRLPSIQDFNSIHLFIKVLDRLFFIDFYFLTIDLIRMAVKKLLLPSAARYM